MIPPVRALRALRSTCLVWGLLSVPAAVAAHDLEGTQVRLTFAHDGSFVLDVSNDPSWLKLRLERFAQPAGPEGPALQTRGRPGPFGPGVDRTFIDRVVLWVDGREVRPTSVEFVPGEPAATYRMRGRMPIDAHTLRWYYGLVADPYSLVVSRADGKVVVETVEGEAWSRTIDVSGQFTAPLLSERAALVLVAVLIAAPIAIRARAALPRRSRTKAEGTHSH